MSSDTLHFLYSSVLQILGTTEYFETSKEVEKPTICPFCNSILYEEGANIFCPNKNCKPRVVGMLCNFASKDGMNIDGFSEKTAGQLYDAFSLNKFSSLYKLTKEDLFTLDGFKDKKIDNLLSAIEKSKTVQFSAFIYALGIDGIGRKTAKDLQKVHKNLQNLKNASVEDLLNIQDIGEITAKNIYDYFNDSENLQEIEELLSLGITIIEEKEIVGGIFSGEKVVLTGSLQNYKRSEAGKLIEELGGEIMSSVGKQTTLVIAGEEAGSKLEKAQKLGVKIIDENTFIDMLKS